MMGSGVRWGARGNQQSDFFFFKLMGRYNSLPSIQRIQYLSTRLVIQVSPIGVETNNSKIK